MRPACSESMATGTAGARFGLMGAGIIQTSTSARHSARPAEDMSQPRERSATICPAEGRPHLFSDASSPPAVCFGAAIDVLMKEPERLARLAENALPEGNQPAWAEDCAGHHADCPSSGGDTALALKFQTRLFEKGVFVSGFGYPVVPQGHARLRARSPPTRRNNSMARVLCMRSGQGVGSNLRFESGEVDARPRPPGSPLES